MEISVINIIQIVVIVFAAGVTIGNLRSRIGKLEKEQNIKYEKLNKMITSRIVRVGQRIDNVENRIDKIETNLNEHDKELALNTQKIVEIQKKQQNQN